MTGDSLERLAALLREDSPRPPDARGVEFLIIWLGGGRHAERERVEGVLGRAGDDLSQLEAAYDVLDRALFVGERLDLEAAGLAAGRDGGEAKRRYRQLIKVFHPDRFPVFSTWLTPRCQAIHDAYARFKQGGPQPHDADTDPDSGASTRPHRDGAVSQPVYRFRNVEPVLPAFIARWRQSLGRVRNLQQKILIGAAVIALLPLFYLYFTAREFEHAIRPVITEIRTEAPASISGSSGTPAGPPNGVPGPVAEVSREAPWWYNGGGLGSDPPVDDPAGDERLADAPASGDKAGQVAASAATGYAALQRWLGRLVTLTTSRTSPAGTDDGDPASDTAATRETAVVRTEPAPLDGDTAMENDGEAERPTGSEASSVVTGPETGPRPIPRASRSGPRQARPGIDDRPDSEPPTPSSDAPATPAPAGAEPERPGHHLSGGIPLAPSQGLTVASADDGSRSPGGGAGQPRDEIMEFLEAYENSIENGNLEQFLGHFTRRPRENRNEGMRWFSDNYGALFRKTVWRRFSLSVEDLRSTGTGWVVDARYNMQLAYPNGDPRESSGQVTYTIARVDGTLRISAIDH